MLLLYSIALGLIVGRLLGGRVRNLEHVRIVWLPLALAGLFVQLLLFADPIQERVGSEGPIIYVASTLVVLAALLRNVRLPGLAIIAAGALLNLIAIVFNGGFMPSSPEAWRALTGVAAIPVEYYSNVTLIDSGTWFPFLGDIFIFPRPLPMATLFSIGDVLIAAGAVVFLAWAMRQPSARPTMQRVTSVQPAAR